MALFFQILIGTIIGQVVIIVFKSIYNYCKNVTDVKTVNRSSNDKETE